MVNILTEICPLGRPLTASFVLLQRTLAEESGTATQRLIKQELWRWRGDF